ncbi:hypothetical protein BDR26DRAFT_1010813 [Obelidium mucronatum]|nr:hypothetical protein BDR26DRAFT_1010813 [Obelidium mucronatum]
MRVLPRLPRLPTWTQLREARPVANEALRAPGMPSDPVFLDKPVRDYLMRYLTVVPVFALLQIALNLIANGPITNNISVWSVCDFVVTTAFCMFGYYALKGMIPEHLILTGYVFFIKSTGELVAALFLATSLSSSHQTQDSSPSPLSANTPLQSQPQPSTPESLDDPSFFVIALIIIILLIILALPILLNYLLIWKILNPLIVYAQECRKAMVVDLVTLSQSIAATGTTGTTSTSTANFPENDKV